MQRTYCDKCKDEITDDKIEMLHHAITRSYQFCPDCFVKVLDFLTYPASKTAVNDAKKEGE